MVAGRLTGSELADLAMGIFPKSLLCLGKPGPAFHSSKALARRISELHLKLQRHDDILGIGETTYSQNQYRKDGIKSRNKERRSNDIDLSSAPQSTLPPFGPLRQCFSDPNLPNLAAQHPQPISFATRKESHVCEDDEEEYEIEEMEKGRSRYRGFLEDRSHEANDEDRQPEAEERGWSYYRGLITDQLYEANDEDHQAEEEERGRSRYHGSIEDRSHEADDEDHQVEEEERGRSLNRKSIADQSHEANDEDYWVQKEKRGRSRYRAGDYYATPSLPNHDNHLTTTKTHSEQNGGFFIKASNWLWP